MKERWALPIVAIVVASGCGGEASQGTWRLVSLDVDGEPFEVDRPLFMDITDDGFHAATTCNSQSGEFGGQIRSTAMACGDEIATAGETYMREAFNSKPVERDGQLVFDSGNVRLVYEAFDVPRTEELFAVLGDPTLSVDESELRERARSFRSHG